MKSDCVFALVSAEGTAIESLRNVCGKTSDINADAAAHETTAQDASSSEETKFLLHTRESLSWTLQSSLWSISSSVLCTITYRPAWQGIPAFTNTSVARDYTRRTCYKERRKPVNFMSIQYTTDDIVRMEHLDDVHVRGIAGSCKGLRLSLRNKDYKVGDIPATMHQELYKHCNLDQPIDESWNRIPAQADDLPPSDHVGPVITFCMPICGTDQFAPPLLWKVSLPQNPNVSLENVTILQGELWPKQREPTHIYLNGYQSWSFAGSVVKGAPQPQSAMPDTFSKAFNLGGSPPPSGAADVEHSNSRPSNCSTASSPVYQYQSDFFCCITADGHMPSSEESTLKRFPYRALDEAGGSALVFGWLSQHKQYGVIEASKDLSQIAMHISFDNTICKEKIETDWAYAELIPPHGYDEEPMVHYLHAVASHNQAKPLQNGPILTGWCSWYHYYEKITAANLRENFSKLQSLKNKLPTNVVVVDDGYMTAWGDWATLKPGKFPHGLKGVADDIIACGMRPGLWIAPFCADKTSALAKKHPDWIIRNDEGRVANSSNCGKFFYGLDATNPYVREYVYSCIRRAVQDWGFTVLKIDFLYACCLQGNGKYDLSMSRAEAMTLALQTIRAAAGPNVFLIGCGCPIGPGIGYIDGNRISADTGPTWYPALPLPYWDNGTLPALRAMIRNSISRAPFGHRWWHNDPDCLLLGKTTSLTDLEVASAASIVAMTCGMFLLSDDLSKVPVERMRIVSKVYPMTGATAVVLDLHSTNDGLPSILRLWCTDRYQPIIRLEDETVANTDHNHEATLLGRYASFDHTTSETLVPSDRKRSCIHVATSMGTWTLLSVSNWTDKAADIRVPHNAMLPPPSKGWQSNADAPDSNDHGPIHKHGFHVLSFWSSEYHWTPDPRLSETTDFTKHLLPHQTEIFHIKPVVPNTPEYIGSAIHFSCGYEVSYIEKSTTHIAVRLRKNLARMGFVYLFIPRQNLDNLEVLVAGNTAEFESFGTTPDALNRNKCLGKVIRVIVAVRGDGSPKDGEISVKF